MPNDDEVVNAARGQFDKFETRKIEIRSDVVM
jgi:hypothetical protein